MSISRRMPVWACSLALSFSFAALAPAGNGQSQAAIALGRAAAAETAAAQNGVKPMTGALAEKQGYRHFGTAKLKEPSAPQTFTLVFHQSTQLTGIAGKGDFKVTGGTCAEGRSYAEDGTCTVEMVFTPTGPGHRTGKLVVSHTASAIPFVVPTGGEGTGPVVSFIPAMLLTVASTLNGPPMQGCSLATLSWRSTAAAISIFRTASRAL